MPNFCQIYDFKSFVNDPTCYKNPQDPTFFDLIIIVLIKPKCFQNSITIETGI